MPKITRIVPGGGAVAARALSGRPRAAAAPYVALSRAADDLANLGLSGIRVAGNVQQMDEDAERSFKALRIENGMRADMDEILAGYAERTDFENFENDIAEQIKLVRDTYTLEAGEDQELLLGTESFYAQESDSVLRVVRTKKRQLVVEGSLAELNTSYSHALQAYSIEDDPAERDFIRTQLQMRTIALVDRGIMSATQAETLIERFDSESELVRVAQYRHADPESTLEILKADGFDLSPKNKQAEIEKTERKVKEREREAKVAENERKSELEAAEKQAKADELEAVGNLWTARDYAGVMRYVSDSTRITGKEQREWFDAADKASKAGDDFDGGYRSDLIVRIGTEPETVDVIKDIYHHVGLGTKEGLTPDQAQSLEKDLVAKQQEADKPKQGRLRQAHDILSRLRSKKMFTSPDEPDPVENELEWRKTVDALDQWQKDNPDEDPVKWIEENVKAPVEESFLGGLMRSAAHFLTHEHTAEAGTRADGTVKGPGYFGTLQRPGGGISTEISIGVEIDGTETEIPLIVPTSTEEELTHLLGGGEATDEMVGKATKHAKKRIKQGKSPFAEEGEQVESPLKVDKRAQAIGILRANGKEVNETTIKQVKDQL